MRGPDWVTITTLAVAIAGAGPSSSANNPPPTEKAKNIDLSEARVVLCAKPSPLERKACQVLVEEVRAKTGINLPVVAGNRRTTGTQPVSICIGISSQQSRGTMRAIPTTD